MEGQEVPTSDGDPALIPPSPQLAVPAPASRDPARYAPVFVLAPARSNSSVVTAMLGQHPDLCVFPELALFRKETVEGLLTDPPGWKGPPTRLRLAGLFRALAQHHDGAQTPETVAASERWVEARAGWRVGDLLDHLLGLAAPRIGLEKSPENSSREEYHLRLDATYPRARYLHLTRHPLPSAISMHEAWSDKGYWKIEPGLFHHFCLGVWYHQHARIHRFVQSLPPDRALTVRSEDVLNDPVSTLPTICRWLGIDSGPAAIDAMTHPECSPYAGTGPKGALGGWDTGFMRDPVLRKTEIPATLDLPAEWIVDPWLELAATQLAAQLGYERRAAPAPADAPARGLSVRSGEVPAERAELKRRIIERAHRDEHFRARLIATPREAVAEELGIELPERLEVAVVQERPDRLAIVLPVDLAGIEYDAVWAMTGVRPRGPASAPTEQ
jgi:hypothetical protein